ncbi:transposase, mutator type [Artemisia annua]|uniref:Transposase, mutator type n=1 Tax=Artemisia annua TaxID=35608 RepID=A0A2U1PKZ5_ARTAN|nr:transposase, mutator type [Artemisia annua]
MKQIYKGRIYKDLLCKCATTTTVFQFQQGIEKMKAFDPKSHERKLVDGRDQPILWFLKYIREYLMKRIVNVQQVIDMSEGPLTPTATAMFKVPWMNQCVVNMRLRTCTCRRWELTGVPCRHVVAAMYDMARNGMEVGIPEDLVHQAYWLSTWKETYKYKIEGLSCYARNPF